MFVSDSVLGVNAFIDNQVMNNLTQNPFRFPRPENVVPVIVVNGIKMPNVSFDNALKYVFDRCLRALLLFFKQNMVETFEQLRHGDDTVSISSFKCGNRKVSRNVYIGIWAFRCSLLSKNGNMAVEDIQVLVDNPAGFEKDFTLFIESGEIKARNSTENPAKFSKAQLERGSTRP